MLPLIGSLSQVGNFVEISDDPAYVVKISKKPLLEQYK